MASVRDPVCGMEIEDQQAAATATHGGRTFHFCSAICKTKFSMHPARYAGTDAGPGYGGDGGHGGGDGHHHSHG